MKIYLVGGAVRDQLLGLPVKERDFVVVGANIDDMLRLGYQQVGKDFPVFLHPNTHEEYALARMERKVKPGYKGFTTDISPDVTLEEDLLRRDLTINAMALDADTKQIIDPYGGQQDLAAKVLRHVSPAFAEDPVRILRVARFLARYAGLGFQVAPETNKLMMDMVASGEVSALIAERVWKELERALGEAHPDKFFEVLENAGALAVLFPELLSQDGRLEQTSTHWQAFLQAIAISKEPIIRLTALLHNLSPAQISALANRYRLPNPYRELATLTARHYATALKSKTLAAEDLLNLFNGLDIYRRPTRFEQFLTVCVAIAKANSTQFDSAWLLTIANAIRNINMQELLSQGLQGQDFANALRNKRLAILKQLL